MLKVAKATFLGLVITIVWLCTSIALNNTALWLTRLVLYPAQLLTRALPHATTAFVFGRDSQGTHDYLFALVLVLFCWLVFAIVTWLIMRRASNISFKTNPLRGSA